MKLLIVDDSKAMRMIVRRMLGEAGFREAEIREASNGLEALEIIPEFAPAVVLSDWNMPEMDGITLLRSLRGEDNQVPFGFVTSECTEDMREAADASGAAFFLTKPFKAEEFRSVLSPVAA